eukprot:s125_g23.t1
MHAVGPRIQNLLQSAVLTSESGILFVEHQSLATVWSRLADQTKAPDWKRFSEFVSRTARSFVISSDSIQSQRGRCHVGNGEASSGLPKIYFAEVLVMLIHDLTGASITPQEMLLFLRQRKAGPGDAHVSCGSSVGSDTSSSGGGASDECGSRIVGDSQCRARKLFLQRSVYNACASQRCSSDSLPDESQSVSSSKPESEVDVPTLLNMLQQRDKTIETLRHDKKRLQQNLRRANERLQKQQKTHDSHMQTVMNRKDFDIQRRNEDWEERAKKWSWLTPMGQINLAVRRNMSNVSQADLGKVILEDLSKKTVSRCEMRAGASLIASARHHFEIMKSQTMMENIEGFSICLHSYRQDASNSRRKVVALELDSAYLSKITPELEELVDWGHFTRIRRLADLGLVGDETGQGCVGVTLRGLQSLGCPTWREINESQSKLAQ